MARPSATSRWRVEPDAGTRPSLRLDLLVRSPARAKVVDSDACQPRPSVINRTSLRDSPACRVSDHLLITESGQVDGLDGEPGPRPSPMIGLVQAGSCRQSLNGLPSAWTPTTADLDGVVARIGVSPTISSRSARERGGPKRPGAGPTSTGPTSTGPTSTGPTSTGPTSTGPTSTGPTSTGLASTGPTSTGLAYAAPPLSRCYWSRPGWVSQIPSAPSIASVSPGRRGT